MYLVKRLYKGTETTSSIFKFLIKVNLDTLLQKSVVTINLGLAFVKLKAHFYMKKGKTCFLWYGLESKRQYVAHPEGYWPKTSSKG